MIASLPLWALISLGVAAYVLLAVSLGRCVGRRMRHHKPTDHHDLPGGPTS